MEHERLLAKSQNREQGQLPTIAWHTKCVLLCANRLLKLRCGDAIEAMGLSQSAIAVLERIVRFAAWLHDIGKCASTFQRVLRREGEQPFRHEAVSWYITSQILDDFLTNYFPDRTERWMLAVCVAGHHRNFYIRDNSAIRDFSGESELYLNHKDFRDWIALIPTDRAMGEPPTFDNKILSASCLHKAMLRTVTDHDDCIFPILSDEQKKIISLAKSFLIASDISASALSQHSIEFDWIDKKLGDRADSDVRKTLLGNKLSGKSLRKFQEIVAQSEAPWTLLKAGCGTGKTAAACKWATRNHKERQLWLTYPTTGTATEGFKDYVMDTHLESSLQHSKALHDLEELNILDISEEKDTNELPQREIALRGWGADTVVATVDTVLGIVQNHKSGHYAYPGILKGALVFDEIHAYDKFLFGSLLRFLEAHPNIPCLLMTASLQESREQALKELHYRLFQKELITVNGPEDLEKMPRYFLSKDDPWTAVELCRQHGGKVLWVSNTVEQCITIGAEAEKKGINPLFYHSHYKYSDRMKRHQDIIQAFKNDASVFASTTQVAEMSLDISADLLITDIAPIPAMIQRLGRLNRRPDTTTTKPFIVITQLQTHRPYCLDELECAKKWLSCLPTIISQQDLINCWSQVSDDQSLTQETQNQSPAYANWLDEPLWTRKSSLREASSGISVVLERDLGSIRKGEKPISYYQINMNRPHRKIADMRFIKGRLIATDDQIYYNETEGASWQKK